MPNKPSSGRYRADLPGTHARAKRRSRWAWIIGLSVVGMLAAVAVTTAVFALQAISVKNDLMSAKSELQTIGKNVKKGDAVRIDATADNILRLTRRAEHTVQGPLWSAAASVPLVGPNADAVRRAAEATSILAEGALPPGVKLMSTLQLDKVPMKGGGIDLEPIQNVSDALPEINAAFDKAQQKLNGVDRTKLLPAVDDAISTLSDVIDDATPVLKNVQHFLPTILDVAGGEGPRTYMLVFQNNAEARSGGGLPAATAIIDVDDGHLTLADQTGTYSFPRNNLVVDLPEETMRLYEHDTFRGFGNFTRTPNFPTTAKAFASLWHMTRGSDLDGVFTIDPIVLSHALKVTGPITTADGRKLTSKNVVEAVMYDAYHRYSGNAAQDAFFADVAARAFTKIAGGKWDPMKMLHELELSVKEQRLHLWFARKDEQAMSVELGLDGGLATSNEKTTEVGIFPNDASYGKLEYFMKTKVSVTCNADDRTITTSMNVTNDTAGKNLTHYQRGIRNRDMGIPDDTFILDMYYFAPPGATITGVDPGPDLPASSRSGVEEGRNAQSIRVYVPAGQTRTFSFTSQLGKGELGPVSVRHTPTVTDTPVSISKSCGELTGAE